MSKGILTVAFGASFDKLAAETMRYSRKFTDLPIHVLTNMKNKNPIWDEISGVFFTLFDMTQKENRKAKLTMHKHSPFDETLYMDCDSVIQNPGVENFTDYFGPYSLVLCHKKTLKGRRIYNIYADTMQKLRLKPPLILYYGAIIAFKKTRETDRFFGYWRKTWMMMGSGREMPSLCCTVKKYAVRRRLFPRTWFGGMKKRPNTIIQHDYRRDFCERFGLSRWADFKPYDKKRDFQRRYI